MVNALFSGCSFFNGDGLELEQKDPNNVVNVFSRTYFGDSVNIVNVSQGGNSNKEIFFEASKEMFNNHYDYVFVGITSYPRYVFYTGLETYDFKRRIVFSPHKTFEDHNGHAGDFSSSWLTDLKNKFLAIHNDHFEIVEIIKNQSLLIKQAHAIGSKIYFINNIAQWDNNYFTYLQNPAPSDLTRYTQTLLDVHRRDDSDIMQLYALIHNDYQQAGGIQHKHWLNLYHSFSKRIEDLGNDNYHPGPITHKNFGLSLAQSLDSNQYK